MAHSGKTAAAHQVPVAMDDGHDEGFYNDKKTNEADRLDMWRLNKPQEMKRNFGSITMFGFSVILMASWEGILTTVIGFTAVYASLGEQGSMAPTSGGQYHWVSEFSPRKYQKELSYIVGWLGVLGWQVGIAFGAFLTGTIIQGLIVLNHPTYIYERWHGTLLIIAVLILAGAINVFLAQSLHLIQGAVLVGHIGGFFGILITLWVLAEPKASSHDVWTTFYDPGWNSQGLSCLVGIVASVSPLLGADAAAHMAEELQDASYLLPRILTLATLINGAMMFIMAVTICYVIGDLEQVLSTPTEYPFIQIFSNITKSLTATNAMTSVILILGFFGCVSDTAGSSRQLFAFARDKGIPFSSWVGRVHPRFDVPVNAIIVIGVVSALISLINIGSIVAFNIVTSLGTGTLTSSYIICISVHVWQKVTGQPMLPSRFNLGRRFGLFMKLVALGWLWLVLIIAFFPGIPDPTSATMNWSVVVLGGVVVFSAVYFVLYGRKSYDGPVAYVRKLDWRRLSEAPQALAIVIDQKKNEIHLIPIAAVSIPSQRYPDQIVHRPP